MEMTRWERPYRWLVGLFVGAVLLAQFATIPFTALRLGDILWVRAYPILEYDMYRDPYYKGDRVDATWNLEGVYNSGVVVQITDQTLGLSVWDLHRILYSVVVYKADYGVSQLKNLITSRMPQTDSLESVRIISLPVKVGRDGPEAVPSQVVATISLRDEE
jgi:hypothetical protein